MTTRTGWKMRKVVEKFGRKSRHTDVLLPSERLECGHVIPDKDEIYGNETAVAINIVLREMMGELPMRRCWECGR